MSQDSNRTRLGKITKFPRLAIEILDFDQDWYLKPKEEQ
jgi:hypothetical protein